MAYHPVDTVTYELLQTNAVVYIGITNNPEEREQQHVREFKVFTHLRITSEPMQRNTAEQKEENDLQAFRDNNGGRNPLYNQTDDG